MIIDADTVALLERSAAEETRLTALVLPEPVPAVQPFGDGVLVAMGAGRYVNRAVGITLRGLTADDLVEVEAFFARAGVPSAVELTSWAPAATVTLLSDRGYRLEWFRSIFACPPGAGDAAPSSFRIAEVTEDLVPTWLEVLAVGNGVGDGPSRATSDEYAMANRALPGTTAWLAFDGAAAVACGALRVVEGVASLGGAATLPQYRGRGAQIALLHTRLHAAARMDDVSLVAASALTAGTSARNLQRAGLHLVHTQAVVQQAAVPVSAS